MNTKKKLGDFILIGLEKAIDGYVSFEDFATNYYKYLYGYPRVIKKSALSKALKRLRENGLIDFVSDEKLAFKLTDSGRDQAVWAAIRNGKETWDGKWRLVIFDIPEKRRQARDLLRSRLKQWGFVHWQKSVWASKKDCTKPLRDFIKQVGIEKWVKVIESDDIG